MSTRTIGIFVASQSALGRGILLGAAAYAHGRLDWMLQPLGADVHWLDRLDSEYEIDALIGTVTHDVLEKWPGEDRRCLVNISRGRDVPRAVNVTCDDAAVGTLAAEHLLAKPVEHLAYIGPRKSGLRREAFVRRAQRAGRDVEVLEFDGVAARLPELVRGLPRHCGLFVFNDDLAWYLLRVAAELDIPVPQDLAVVGVDNDPVLNAFSPVPLTSVDPDFYRIGYEAARALDVVLRGAAPPAEPVRIPPKGVIERNSSDYPSETDALVVRAARMIRAGACRGLTVDEIADKLPVSYWTLNRRFRAAFGRTLLEELIRLRLAEAARLLSTTRLPLAEIAEQVGYGNAKHLSTSFSKHMGMPPSTYRKQRAEK